MSLPTVVIIGRPNVGKSSLLNALAGEMVSIVEPTAGVTRDRVSVFIEHDDNYFELVDTGGYGIVDSDQLKNHVEGQITRAIATADLILFVVDIRDGLTPLDKKIGSLLRKNGLSAIVVANKADDAKLFPAAGEFTQLGFGEALCVSATNNMNKTLLAERVISELKHLGTSKKPAEIEMKIAIVGKRNAGKSTLTNAIAGSERVIVSEFAGTTRDAVDVRFDRDGKTFMIIDTAGVRKKGKLADSIEFYSYVRATRSVQRADIVFFMLDSTVPLGQVDKKLAAFIGSEYKPCILIVNKWDLAKEHSDTDAYAEYIGKIFPQLSYAPIAFTTASESKNVQSVLDLAAELFKQATAKIPTSKLNKAIEHISQMRLGGRRSGGKFPKIYYATQVTVNPVTVLLFVNDVSLFDENYRRFLISQLRQVLDIEEVPLRLLIKPRTRRE